VATTYALFALSWLVVADAIIASSTSLTSDQYLAAVAEDALFLIVATTLLVVVLRHRARAISESVSLFDAVFENNDITMYVVDRETLRFLAVNDATVRRYGWTRTELLDLTLYDIRPREDIVILHRALLDAVGPMTRSGEFRHRTKRGEIFWVEITRYAVDYRGHAAHFVVAHDITARRAMDSALEDHRLRLEAIVNTAVEGIVTADEHGVIESVNARAAKMFGHDAEALVGRNIELLMPSPFAERHGASIARYVETGEAHIIGTGRELVGARADGSTFPIRLALAEVRLPDRRLFTAAIQDLTEQKEFEQLLADRSLHDPLTGLANRVLLTNRLSRLCTRAAASGTPSRGAVLYVDVDEFRRVNEAFGYSLGNDTLLKLAKRLQLVAGERTTVGRFSSDEFVIIAADAADLDAADDLARRVQDAVGEPLDLGDHHVQLSAAIGSALVTGDHSADEVLRAAEAAAGVAKLRGHGQRERATTGGGTQAVERLVFETELREAVDADEIVVHYQPVVDLTDGSIVGFEALARWRHPRLGLLAPAEFVPVAESIGLIRDLGARLLERACREAVEWPDRSSGGGAHVSVNLSMLQLADPLLVQRVTGALSASGLDPERLFLEVTEHIAIRESPGARRILEAIRALGVRVAIDDFGTGYSSFAYLKRLPIDLIKIDGSLIADVPSDPIDNAIVRAIVELGRSISVPIVAEGVERTEQRDGLRDIGCRYAQGYLFGRAAPPDDARMLLGAEVRA
jgi:PAS domain S-box-containing protein/diguanylate cyclase (GGDEF)-like protein